MIYVWVIGSQGREMKSTVMTSRLGTETAWHRSRLSHMWNCTCLWHLRLLDMGYSVITLGVWYWSSHHIAFSPNTFLFVEICLLSQHPQRKDIYLVCPCFYCICLLGLMIHDVSRIIQSYFPAKISSWHW